MSSRKQKWHGYLHTSGTIQVKPLCCEIDTGSDMVQKYIPPFEVGDNGKDIRKEAIEKATQYIKETGTSIFG